MILFPFYTLPPFTPYATIIPRKTRKVHLGHGEPGHADPSLVLRPGLIIQVLGPPPSQRMPQSPALMFSRFVSARCPFSPASIKNLESEPFPCYAAGWVLAATRLQLELLQDTQGTAMVRGEGRIRVRCDGCRASYSVATALRGRWARCKHCGEKFRIGVRRNEEHSVRQAPSANRDEQTGRGTMSADRPPQYRITKEAKGHKYQFADPERIRTFFRRIIGSYRGRNGIGPSAPSADAEKPTSRDTTVPCARCVAAENAQLDECPICHSSLGRSRISFSGERLPRIESELKAIGTTAKVAGILSLLSGTIAGAAYGAVVRGIAVALIGAVCTIGGCLLEQFIPAGRLTASIGLTMLAVVVLVFSLAAPATVPLLWALAVIFFLPSLAAVALLPQSRSVCSAHYRIAIKPHARTDTPLSFTYLVAVFLGLSGAGAILFRLYG